MLMVHPLALIVLPLMLVGLSHQQNTPPPSSPCPDKFVYKLGESGWYGALQLYPPPYIGSNDNIRITLNITFTLRARIQSNYNGEIQLLRSDADIIKDIRNNRPIQYIVRFPFQFPLPKLTEILLNNEVVCVGPTDVYPYLSTIRLHHTLYGGLKIQTVQPNYYNQSPYYEHNNRPGVTNYQPGVNNNQRNGNNRNEFLNNDWNIPSLQPDKVQIQLLNVPNTYNGAGTDYNINQPEEYYPIDVRNSVPTPAPTLRPFQQQPVAPQQPKFVIPNPTQQPYTPPAPPPYQSDNEICGRPDNRFLATPLVVRGDSGQRGEWPWQVAIYIKDASSMQFHCGGNLISNRHVVTAAHCFQRTKTTKVAISEMLLLLGRYNIEKYSEEGSEYSDVDQMIHHPDWMPSTGSFDADIGVIVTSKCIAYNEYIRPICLWSGGLDLPAGEEGTVVGWGRTETEKVSAELRVVRVPIATQEDCLRSNPGFWTITSNRTFCAGRLDETGPCNGDSGGGFCMLHKQSHRWMLRGLVSTALNDQTRVNCNLRNYVVFTDAAKFSSWLTRVVASSGGVTCAGS